MIQYTTPTFTFKVDGVDLTQNQKLWVTLVSEFSENKLTLTDPAVEYIQGDSYVTVELTQAQSGTFEAGDSIKAMINIMTPQGKRSATSKTVIVVEENYIKQELSYD